MWLICCLTVSHDNTEYFDTKIDLQEKKCKNDLTERIIIVEWYQCNGKGILFQIHEKSCYKKHLHSLNLIASNEFYLHEQVSLHTADVQSTIETVPYFKER